MGRILSKKSEKVMKKMMEERLSGHPLLALTSSIGHDVIPFLDGFRN